MKDRQQKVIFRLPKQVKIPTNMWDNRPVTGPDTGLTSRLHVGKVWRDQTDMLSVSARIRRATWQPVRVSAPEEAPQ